ncbi:g11830 [Coccomyxa viridis]|uniref:G11830 protein n=1 Tax=Coccomyxa viridis TaxID=1274662 RepID=A0ABP1GBJ9_9CHLO
MIPGNKGRMMRDNKRKRLTRIYDDEGLQEPPNTKEISAPEAQQLPENVHLDDEPAEDELTADAIPCDTLAAILLLKSQFPSLASKNTVPFALRSQLYTIVNDRTIVDRELDTLRLQNTLRVVKLTSMQDEYAYLLTEDYVALISRIITEQEEKGTLPEVLSGLATFGDILLPDKTGIDISHDDLLRHLQNASGDGKEVNRKVVEAQLSLLLNVGLLTRHTASRDRYLFAMPNAGPLVRAIVAGRKEVMGILSRRRHPEMFVKELEKKKLRDSRMGMQFHIRDLLGSGQLLKSTTTSGPLLRIVKKL